MKEREPASVPVRPQDRDFAAWMPKEEGLAPEAEPMSAQSTPTHRNPNR
jgi:hypothetical protein